MIRRITPQHILSALIILLIGYTVYLASTGVLHNDIGFNTDLARDFLLLQDVVQNHKLPLIGPRSGGIPGLFHGPLWIYVNLPAFLISQGNPVGVGWFWILLIVFLVGASYVIGRKIYGHFVGLLAALLISCLTVPAAWTIFNPFGAVLLSLPFFYCLYVYLEKYNVKYLLAALFLLGLIIQFQVAFGGPLLALSMPLLLYVFFKKKKFAHIAAFLILLLPLSTYVLFDIRHEFLQFKGLLSYVTADSGASGAAFTDLLGKRLEGFIYSLVAVSYPPDYLKFLILGYFGFLGYRLVKDAPKKKDRFIFLFFYFYLGYWLITLLFRGEIWSYYYWPFLPVIALILAAGLRKMHTGLFIVFYILICGYALTYAQTFVQGYSSTYIGKDAGSWLFNYNLAKQVFSQNDKQFGYYVFSPDEYGYSPRYAMDYEAKNHPEVSVSPYKKERVTYLLISAPGGKDNGINGDWWKENRVKIQKKPVQSWNYPNGFKIEKYELTEKELQVPSDPNLIQTIIFR